MGVPIRLESDEREIRYDGPHGPMTIPGDQAADEARVAMPEGVARLGWSMTGSDGRAFRDGVELTFGDRRLALRREDRTLVLRDEGGGVLAVTRRRRRGRVEIEDAAGAPLAWFRAFSEGEVEPAAEPVHVALLGLLLISNAAATLDRGIPLLPF